jgi:hypothetical protein
VRRPARSTRRLSRRPTAMRTSLVACLLLLAVPAYIVAALIVPDPVAAPVVPFFGQFLAALAEVAGTEAAYDQPSPEWRERSCRSI